MKCRIKLILGIVIFSCLLIVASCSDDNSTKPNKVANPVFSLSSGIYNTFLQVEISCATEDAEIHFTFDGREPTEAAELYSGAIDITSSKTIRAKAFKDNYQPSSIIISEYELVLPTVAKPTFSLLPGLYNFPQDITLNCATSDSEIYFTIDGSIPTTSSNLFTEPIGINTDTTIRARAFKISFNQSEIASAEYVIDSLKVATPTFSPEPNMYNDEQTITISCSTPGAEIHYTTDGHNPSMTSPLYSNPFEISSSSMIKAYALKDGYLPSAVIMAEYEIDYINTAIPIFSPTPGIYIDEQVVTLQSTTEEAEIHYTLDGSEPNNNSPLYNNNLIISSTTIIKAMAISHNYLPSKITTATYTIHYQTVSTPEFNPTPGMYVGQQAVSITSFTPGATIYYTLDGSQPDESSFLYSNPITISTNSTIKARAYKLNLLTSEVGLGDYQIFDEIVSTPQFTPVPGNYPDEQIVTISCSTLDATIYYTVDSTEPTESSDIYNVPLDINSSTIIKARAFKDNSIASEIAVGHYMIGDPSPYSFILVEGGTFNNGTADNTISNFYICEHEVTQYEYVASMGNNPSFWVETYNPVENVTWFEAVKYCNLLSINEGLPPCYNYNNEGTNPNMWSADWNSSANHENLSCDFSANGYRLPTEMEWMYAAKGGIQTPETDYNQWSGTDIQSQLISYAWYIDNSTEIGTKQVKSRLPNQLGIWDMSGNVYEWCWDIHGDYSSETQTDPVGPNSGNTRVLRGGGHNSGSGYCTVNYRTSIVPSCKYGDVGFRVVRSVD